MILNPRLSVVSVTAILVVAALAGCAPASVSGSGTSGGASSAPSTVPSHAAAAHSGAMTGLPASCPAAGLVSSKLGISASDPTQSGDSVSLNCAYNATAPADNLSINFTTAKKLTPDQAEASLKAQGSTPAFSKLSGVGDFAFYDQVRTNGALGAYITVSSGPVAFHVVVNGTETKQQLIDLANAIIAS